MVIVAFSMYLLRGYTARAASVFKLKQDPSLKKILLTSFLGVYLHILLDAPLHAMYDLRVPHIELTPTGLGIYSFCTLSFLVGLALCKRRTAQRATRTV